MSARDLRTLLPVAEENVRREIAGNASHGHLAGGLASEGYAGGYQACLRDVDAILRGIIPSDHRNYWRRQQ